MPRIFVNYRTGDGDFAAVVLHDRLSERFGEHAVFLASRNIEPGQDFEQVLLSDLLRCTVVFVLIGQHWLDADDNGARQIDRPGDWVRREVIEAWEAGIRVVPVFLDNTPRLGPESRLPADLAPLVNAQYVKLRHRHVPADVAVIVDHVDEWDGRLPTIDETELRAYLLALTGSLSRTQSWLPYADMDKGYLDRRVAVDADPFTTPADGTPHQHAAVPPSTVRWRDAIRDVPVAVVLADAGHGKTWLLRHHCLVLCRKAIADLDAGTPPSQVVVPLMLHALDLARTWAGSAEQPPDVIAAAALGGLRLSGPKRLVRFLAARMTSTDHRATIVIDAYDEVFDLALRDALDQALGWLSERRGPTVLLSSRPSGFVSPFHSVSEDDEDDDEEIVVRYLRLGTLSEGQVRELWANWYRGRGMLVPHDRLAPVLAPLSPLRSVAGVPLIAAFCAWVAESGPVVLDRSGLYGQVVDRFLAQSWKQDAPADFGPLRHDPALRARFQAALTDLAWHMATADPVWLDAIAVHDCETLLGRSFGGVPADSSLTFRAVRIIGILVLLSGADLGGPVAWIHRSVHQYVVAQRLVTQAPETIASLVEENGWFRPQWRDVFDFAIGIEAAGSGPANVTDAVRRRSLDGRDGLGWHATMFVAGCSVVANPSGSGDDVVAQVWRLYRAGFLSATHLSSVLSLYPRADLAEIADLVLADGAETRPVTWDALAWCGDAGIQRLRQAVLTSPTATGACAALHRIAPEDAVAAMSGRLHAGLPVHPVDRAALSELPDTEFEAIRHRFSRQRGSAELARQLAWTGLARAYPVLAESLDTGTPSERAAAVLGLAAALVDEPEPAPLDRLLATALTDRDAGIRTLARDRLVEIGTDLTWVERKLDRHWIELHRDDTAAPLDDLDAVAARLREPGPSTITAVAMLEADREIFRGPVREAFYDLAVRALEGRLEHRLITRVAAFGGDTFAGLAVEDLRAGRPARADRLHALVAGLCRARPDDPEVFDAFADRIAADPDPVLGTALLQHELDPFEKVTRLVARLRSLPAPNRRVVEIWADVAWSELLNVPQPRRAELRDACAEATAHVLGLAEA